MAAAGGSSEPLPPSPGAVRAAPRRGAQGHDTAAGGAGPPAPPPAPRCSALLRASPPARVAGSGGKSGGDWWGEAVSSRWLSPDGQRKPLAELAASPSQCTHLAERRGRGERIAAFLGEVPASPAKPNLLPPPPPHPRPPGPASIAAARTFPPSAPQPLRCPPCPTPCPTPAPRAPGRQPLPHGETKEPPLKGRTGGSRLVLNGIFLLAPPLFSFSAPPKRAAPLETGDISGGSVSCHR